MTGIDRRAPVSECQLEDERRDVRAIRRALVSGSAILGVAPFVHALAPNVLPSLVDGLEALWSAIVCALAALGVEELLLWRAARRWPCRCPNSHRDGH